MHHATIIVTRLTFGLAFSTLIGLLAYRRKSLSRSGILGAVITGTLIFGMGGLLPGLLLIAFFVSSSALSRYKASRKQDVAEKFDKTAQRDLGQALANGGAAAIFATASGLWLLDNPWHDVVPDQTVPTLLFAAVLGALATVTADTWATEIGVLSKKRPRLVTDLRRVVEPGTSGGITVRGLLAALGGSAFMGGVEIAAPVLLLLALAVLGRQDIARASMEWWTNCFGIFPVRLGVLLLVAPVAGLIGSLADSLLGATVQGIYYSEARQKETERPFDRDGTPNRLVRGWRWLNNDWVNFLSSLVGAAVAMLIVELGHLAI